MHANGVRPAEPRYLTWATHVRPDMVSCNQAPFPYHSVLRGLSGARRSLERAIGASLEDSKESLVQASAR